MAIIPLDQMFGGAGASAADASMGGTASPSPQIVPFGSQGQTQPQAPAAQGQTQQQPTSQVPAQPQPQGSTPSQDLSLANSAAGLVGTGANIINQFDPGTVPDEVGEGAGALGGGLSLASGISNGNPMQAAKGAINLVKGASDISGSLGGPTVSSLASDAVDAIAPEASEAIGAVGDVIGDVLPFAGALYSGFTTNPGTPEGANAASHEVVAAAAAAAMSAAMANPVGVFAAPVLGVALAINQALNPKTNADINKAAGQVGPGITAALGNAAKVSNSTDFSTMAPADLQSSAQMIGNALMGGYSSAGAGMGTSTSQTLASRYMSANPVQNGQNIQDAQNGLLKAIGAMQKAGIDPSHLFDSQIETTIQNMNAGGLDPRLKALQPQGFGNPGVASGYGSGNYGDNLNAPTFQASVLGGSTWLLLSKMGLMQQPDRLAQYGVTPPQINQTYLDSRKNSAPSGQTMDQSQFWGPDGGGG